MATDKRRGYRAVVGFVDGMRGGTFPVNPAEGKKTCRFCDYRAVCRYERYRIQRKKRLSTDYTDYTDSDLKSRSVV